MKRTIYYPKQLLWFIVLHFCIDVHSCFAVFVSGKVLDGLWINTSIEKIGNVSVPQLMRGYIKVQRISDFGLIFLGHAQRWGNRVFDALPIHILIIVPGLSGADNDILPHSLKLRSSQRLPFAVVRQIIAYGIVFLSHYCYKYNKYTKHNSIPTKHLKIMFFDKVH